MNNECPTWLFIQHAMGGGTAPDDTPPEKITPSERQFQQVCEAWWHDELQAIADNNGGACINFANSPTLLLIHCLSATQAVRIIRGLFIITVGNARMGRIAPNLRVLAILKPQDDQRSLNPFNWELLATQILRDLPDDSVGLASELLPLLPTNVESAVQALGQQRITVSKNVMLHADIGMCRVVIVPARPLLKRILSQQEYNLLTPGGTPSTSAFDTDTGTRPKPSRIKVHFRPAVQPAADTRTTPEGTIVPAVSPMDEIRVVLHSGKQEVYLSKDTPLITVGRSSDCLFRVNFPGVSRKHCTFLYAVDKIVLLDHSKNGTVLKDDATGATTVIKMNSFLLPVSGSISPVMQAGSENRTPSILFRMLIPPSRELRQE